MRYLTNEISFDVPFAFQDESLHVLYPTRTAIAADVPDVHVTIGRAALGDRPLEEQLPRSSAEEGIVRDGVTVRRRRTERLEAIEQAAVVKVAGDVLFERTTLIRLGDRALVLSCVAPVERRRSCDGVADAIVESLCLRRGGRS